MNEERRVLIQPAVESDIDAICSFDAIAQREDHRRNFVSRSVAAGNCFAAVEEKIAGYAVLEYTFYDNGFVSMLYVHPDRRRRGVGAALMKHLESICQTTKIFTSTNLSNLPMHTLLAKLGYTLSGVIHNLDDNDPEVVYVKFLKQ